MELCAFGWHIFTLHPYRGDCSSYRTLFIHLDLAGLLAEAYERGNITEIRELSLPGKSLWHAQIRQDIIEADFCGGLKLWHLHVYQCQAEGGCQFFPFLSRHDL